MGILARAYWRRAQILLGKRVGTMKIFQVSETWKIFHFK